MFSGTATGVSMIAFPWLVLERTGSAGAAGLLGAITALPLLRSFLFAGVFVDMAGRRLVAIVSDLLSMTSVALVPLLSLKFDLGFAALGALAVLGAVFDPAGISAREAMLPEATLTAGLRLERANGIAGWVLYGPVGPLVNLMIKHRTPGVMRGRVVGPLTNAAYVAGPIGYLISGPMVQFSDSRPLS